MTQRSNSSTPGSRSGPNRSIGSLVSAAVPDMQRWVRIRRGVAQLGGESVGDIVQSVCREALEARGAFQDHGDKPFRAWMRTLTERKISDRARHWGAVQRDASRRRGLDAELHEPAAREDSPEDLASQRDLAAHVLRHVDRLPAEQATVLRLQVTESLSTAEIADRLGKSEGAVRILRCRGLATLGRILEDPDVV